MTLLSSLFFIQDESIISDEFLTALFILLILMNTVYLVYWCISIMPVGIKMVAKLFTRCCPQRVERFESKYSRYYTRDFRSKDTS